MKLSIIVPVFNKERYIEETLQKLTKIQVSEYEIIIVDDGSTDNSFTIINNWVAKNNNIKVLHQVNTGVSEARNAGVKLARGEWIWFVDADDLPNTSFAEEAMKMAQIKQFDIYIGSFLKSDMNKSVFVTNSKEGIYSDIELLRSFAEIQEINGYYGYLWNKIISKKLIDSAGATFRKGLTLAEDLDFMITLYSHCETVYFSKTIAMCYRTQTENSSSERKIDYDEQLKIHIKIKKWFEEKGVYEDYADYLNVNITRYAAYSIYYANEDNISPITKARELLANSEVKNALVKWDNSSVMGRIAYYLRKEQYKRLYIYLKVRNIIRYIHRRGK